MREAIILYWRQRYRKLLAVDLVFGVLAGAAITARFLEPTSLAPRWLLVPLALGGGVLAVLCVKWAGPGGEGRWQLDKLSESIGAAKAPDARRVHRLTKVSAASFAIAAATLLLLAIR